MNSPTGVDPLARRRVTWALTDQGLSSVTNFALGVLVARIATAREFGAFALAYTTYILALGISRALSSEPLVVRHSRNGAHNDDIRAALGSSLAWGIAAACLSFSAALLLPGPAHTAMLALALVLPALLLQDCLRYVSLTQGEPRWATFNDALWLVVQAVAVAAIVASHGESAAAFIIAWGLAALAGAALALARYRVRPSLGCGVRWTRDHHDLTVPFLSEFVVLSAGAQITLYVLSATTGLQELGALRAAQLIFGPLNVLFLGTRLALVSEGARVAHDLRQLRTLAGLVSAGLASTSVAYLGVFLLAPSSIGQSLFGASWLGCRAALPAVGVAMFATGVAAGAAVGLRAMGAAARSLKARLAVLPVTLTLGVFGSLRAGSVGAAWGLAAAGWFAAAIFWRHLVLELGARSEADLGPHARVGPASSRLSIAVETAATKVPAWETPP